jgi:hypothetical protein
MNSVLSRLIDHALDPGGMLRPRTLGRYEPARHRPDAFASDASADRAAPVADVTHRTPMPEAPEGPPRVVPMIRSATPDRIADRLAAPVRPAALDASIERRQEPTPAGIVIEPADPIAPSRTTRSRGPSPPRRLEAPAAATEVAPRAGPAPAAGRSAERSAARAPTPSPRADVLPSALVNAPPPRPARPAGPVGRRRVLPDPPGRPSIERAARTLPAAEPSPPISGPAAPVGPNAVAAIAAATSGAAAVSVPQTPHADVPPPAARSARVPPPRRRTPSVEEGPPSEPARDEPDEIPSRIGVATVRHQLSSVTPTRAILDDEGWRPTESTRAGPIVRVSIGRIEVRAMTAPAPRPRSEATRRSTAPSLDDYLRARNGTGR